MNAGERRLLDYFADRSGSFFKSLFDTLFRASNDNLMKLAKGFPEEAEAVNYWRYYPGYAERLEKEGRQDDQRGSKQAQGESEETATERRDHLRAVQPHEEKPEAEDVPLKEG